VVAAVVLAARTPFDAPMSNRNLGTNGGLREDPFGEAFPRAPTEDDADERWARDLTDAEAPAGLDEPKAVASPRLSLAERSSVQRNVAAAVDVFNPYNAGFLSSKLAYLLNDIFHMSIFGIGGTLGRTGLDLLFGPTVGAVTSHYSALFEVLPPNALGSFLIGFLVGSDDAFQPHLPYIHTGLATGLCGSLTTFSSWNQQLVAMFARGKNPSNQWLRAMFALVIGLEIPLFSFILGLHTERSIRFFLISHVYAPRDDELARLYREYRALRSRARQPRHSLSFVDEAARAAAALKGGHDRWGRRRPKIVIGSHEDIAFHRRRFYAFLLSAVLSMVLLALAAIGVALDPDQTRKSYWMACIFAPFGVMLRWQLSVHLNGRHPWLPLGTLSANILASCLDAVADGVLLRVNSFWAIVMLRAFVLGFNGSLSTVSTFVAELYRERNIEYAYAYASLSVLSCLGLGLAIYGPQYWTR
jgi:CrcB protein